VPVLARRIGAHVVFSPANYGPLTAPRTVILLRNALNVAFVERRPAKLAYWAMVFLGTAISLVTCRRAIAVSRYAMRSASAGLLRLVGGRISIIPHGVNTMFSARGADEPREDFLLAVSDIYVQKNMHNLLLAVARVKASHPDVLLRIAGRPIDQAYFESLQQAVIREGLERNVAFLGHVAPKDLVALYRRCALFVFPSSVETFGNPLVEAMACGAPIACADAAAMPEVVGDAAILFDPADPGDMADKIARVIDDRALADALGKRGLDRARLYSWDRTARLTADVLIDAAGRSTAGRATPADAIA
jgi:glycosyltransferase involved in cell wall biosynthesis